MGAVELTREPALSDAPIRVLPPNEAARRLDELAALLVDAVESGASVNFMRGLTPDEAAGFWRGQLPGLADGSRILMAAEAGGRIVGTAMVTFAHQPNQPHRADITKMLVHSGLRRQGLGARLLAAAEAAAGAAGRTSSTPKAAVPASASTHAAGGSRSAKSRTFPTIPTAGSAPRRSSTKTCSREGPRQARRSCPSAMAASPTGSTRRTSPDPARWMRPCRRRSVKTRLTVSVVSPR